MRPSPRIRRAPSSKLLERPILEVAVLFQSQHKQHRDALAATIQRAGGKPVDPQKMSDYAWPKLASQQDVLDVRGQARGGGRRPPTSGR